MFEMENDEIKKKLKKKILIYGILAILSYSYFIVVFAAERASIPLLNLASFLGIIIFTILVLYYLSEFVKTFYHKKYGETSKAHLKMISYITGIIAIFCAIFFIFPPKITGFFYNVIYAASLLGLIVFGITAAYYLRRFLEAKYGFESIYFLWLESKNTISSFLIYNFLSSLEFILCPACQGKYSCISFASLES